MKTKIFAIILVGALVCGFFCGCYDRDYFANKGKEHWGRNTGDFVGVWKAYGKNYGKDYESKSVDVPTIAKLSLKLFSNGTFEAMNWPKEERQMGGVTGRVVFLSVVHGTWQYKYYEKDRYGVLTIRYTHETLDVSGVIEELDWMPERKGQTLRMGRHFANFIYLEKVEPSETELKPSAEKHL